MKDSNDDTVIPKKIAKVSREELLALDQDALVDKILTLSAQVNELTQSVKRSERNESVALLQVIQKDKEVKKLIKERNDAYYSGIGNGPTSRSQLLDPFLYEGFISMKEKLAAKDKEIATLKEINTALESGKDSKILNQFLESKNTVLRKLREAEKNARSASQLESRLALAHAALRAVRKERKDNAHEIAERDARIAEVENELSSLRNDMTEETASEHTEGEEEMRTSHADEADVSDQKPATDLEENEDDVVVLDDSGGLDVDVSVVHNTGEMLDSGDSIVSEERSVSVDKDGVLKITV